METANAFFRLSNDLMAVTDGALVLVHVNPAWETQLGYQPDILVGQSLLDVIAPRERNKVRQTLKKGLETGASHSFDAAILRATQQLRRVHITVSADPDASRLYVVARDITARQRLERELAAAQKLEAVGQLAAGIAHEINTPTQFIGDNLAFLGDAFSQARPLLELLRTLDSATAPDVAAWATVRKAIAAADLAFLLQEVPQSLSSAGEGVDRVAELVRGLREFAHPDSPARQPADLNRAIERTIVVSRNEWKYVADIKTNLQELPLVPCHLSALNQVLLNLICNASHAIADALKARGQQAQKGCICISSSSDGHVVTIAVQDTGAGIPEAVRSRIFEPFFTTKELGRGTGQGLAIARAIVCDKHGGRLDFESKVGVGTTFYIRLPLEPDTVFAERAA